MMKKAMRIITMVVVIVLLSPQIVFANSNKTTIPNTNVKVDQKVVTAFTDLEFVVRYDKKMEYAGLFSVAQHAIIMKNKKKNHILHEMGHFVARLKNAADETDEFMKIYKAEKRKYKGAQKAYITKNSKEYFAQSFMEFTKNPTKLKNSRPQTYKFVKKQVDSICQQDIDNMYAAYSWAW